MPYSPKGSRPCEQQRHYVAKSRLFWKLKKTEDENNNQIYDITLLRLFNEQLQQ